MEKSKRQYEIMSDRRSEGFWKEDPEGSLAGRHLVSAETFAADDWQASPNRKLSKMMFTIAQEQPERFLELVGYLPFSVQDIFLQYYLLGRTQEQIGELLECGQTAVWQNLRAGITEMARVIAGDEVERKEGEQQKTIVKVYSSSVGSFVLSIDDRSLDLHFSPGTIDGAVRRGE